MLLMLHRRPRPWSYNQKCVEIEMVSTETSEQLSVVEADEVTTTLDPSIDLEVPITEPSSSVVVIQPLINLEEEPIATDVEEELEATVNPSAV